MKSPKNRLVKNQPYTKRESYKNGILFFVFSKLSQLYHLVIQFGYLVIFSQHSRRALAQSTALSLSGLTSQYSKHLSNFSTANFSPAEIQKQNQDLVNHANDFLTDEDSGLPVFLEPEAVQLLSFWCRTPQQMRRFIGIILNAKYRVEKDHQDIGVLIPLDDEELKPLMTKALRRYFNALRSNEKHIKNVENYEKMTK